ncbi:MAG: exo-alpha-sialidase [Candidatus Omnitrophica bacterium]|nr:exo-alpha-sialidase [Candidatus Omnitrophota bacterium]
MKRIFMVCFTLFIGMFVSTTLEGAPELIWNTAPQLLETSEYEAYDPQVAMSGDKVVAVWQQYDGSYLNIYSSCSTDGGATWETAQMLETANYDAYSPQVAISGDKVVAVWLQRDGTYNSIYSNCSTDGGATWETAQLLETADYNADYPQVAISGDKVVAVWPQSDGTDDNIYARYSTDGGATWETAQLLETADYDADDPQVAMSGDKVVAVWYQRSGSYASIYSNYSTDGGATWETAQLLETADYDAYYPQVAMSGDKVVAVWRQSDGTYNNIHARYSTDGGATWETAQLLETANYDAESPQVAMDGNKVAAVWLQSDGSSVSIYSNYSTDGGATWGTAQLLENNTTGDAYGPQVAVSGDKVVAVWSQYFSSFQSIYANFGQFVDLARSDGWCFIATAAYGTPMASEVMKLQDFRDRHLLTNRAGRAFVRWYYKHSPSAASYISRRPAVRMLVRTVLRPLAWLVSLR